MPAALATVFNPATVEVAPGAVALDVGLDEDDEGALVPGRHWE